MDNMEKKNNLNFLNIYKDKNVLVTGHTGFKGSWLVICLLNLGANVVGYSLNPKNKKDNFELSKIKKRIIDIRGDIRNTRKISSIIKKYKIDLVFHLAAQPLVRDSYELPKYTYEVNLMGTINVLEAIRKSDSVKSAVFITTDKCYENVEKLEGYIEEDKLGGHDPYSSSKAACEIAINSYIKSFFNLQDIFVASVRAGNVIGGGDWSKDRIIPDIIRSYESKKPIKLRSPSSIRPWQHVIEPIFGYLELGSRLYEGERKLTGAWNFGPEEREKFSVYDIVKLCIKDLKNIEVEDISKIKSLHEASKLSLNISKAKKHLNWKPRLSIDKTIDLTLEWYKKYNFEDVYELCTKQINYYVSLI